ncbi:MAG: hypothetical protein ABW189_01855 [Rickettsiales bacterium]
MKNGIWLIALAALFFASALSADPGVLSCPVESNKTATHLHAYVTSKAPNVAFMLYRELTQQEDKVRIQNLNLTFAGSTGFQDALSMLSAIRFDVNGTAKGFDLHLTPTPVNLTGKAIVPAPNDTAKVAHVECNQDEGFPRCSLSLYAQGREQAHGLFLAPLLPDWQNVVRKAINETLPMWVNPEEFDCKKMIKPFGRSLKIIADYLVARFPNETNDALHPTSPSSGAYHAAWNHFPFSAGILAFMAFLL